MTRDKKVVKGEVYWLDGLAVLEAEPRLKKLSEVRCDLLSYYAEREKRLLDQLGSLKRDEIKNKELLGRYMEETLQEQITANTYNKLSKAETLAYNNWRGAPVKMVKHYKTELDSATAEFEGFIAFGEFMDKVKSSRGHGWST